MLKFSMNGLNGKCKMSSELPGLGDGDTERAFFFRKLIRPFGTLSKYYYEPKEIILKLRKRGCIRWYSCPLNRRK